MTIAPPSPPFIAARWHGGPQTPRAIVIHGTVSPCETGQAHAVAEFFANHDQPTSAHYVVSPGDLVQCVGDHTVAYHCGYNQDSIGVELCDPQTGPGTRWQDKQHRAMLARAAELVAQLCLAYDIEPARPSVADLKKRGPHGIYGHDDSRRAFGHTTHSDPGPDFPWTDFLDLVHGSIDAMRVGETVISPKRYPRADDALATSEQALKATANPERRALWIKLRALAVKLGGRPKA